VAERVALARAASARVERSVSAIGAAADAADGDGDDAASSAGRHRRHRRGSNDDDDGGAHRASVFADDAADGIAPDRTATDEAVAHVERIESHARQSRLRRSGQMLEERFGGGNGKSGARVEEERRRRIGDVDKPWKLGLRSALLVVIGFLIFAVAVQLAWPGRCCAGFFGGGGHGGSHHRGGSNDVAGSGEYEVIS
jgi:hypothetical protein